MAVFWKERPAIVAEGSQTLDDSRFLVRAAKVYGEAGGELARILGRPILQPKLAINPRLRRNNFGELRVEGGVVTVLLNPQEGITKPFAIHELMHVARVQRHGKLEGGVRKSIEESCSIMGECGISAVDLDKASAKITMLKDLNKTETAPDSFAVALTIITSFAEQEKRKPSAWFGGFSEVSEAQGKTMRMERALRRAERSIDASQWEDPRFAPIEHKVGAGVALLLFAMNNFDVRLSIREAGEATVSEMILSLANKISSNEKEMVEELDGLRGLIVK